MEDREAGGLIRESAGGCNPRRRARLLVVAFLFGLVPPTIGSVVSPQAVHATTAYESAVLADHPTAYYRLDESSGTTARDSSGNGLDGTYQPGVTLGVTGAILSDPSDTAVSGSGTILTANGVTAGATGNSPRTFEFWFKTTTPSGGSNNPSVLWSAGDAAFEIFNDTQIDLVGSNGNNETSIPYALDDGLWHQVAVAYDGSTAVIYVDGNSVATLSPTFATSSSSSISLGPYTGSYDEFAIYPGALTTAQINAHWSIGASTSNQCATAPTSAYAKAVLAQSPDLYFPLKDRDANSSAQVAYDASGHCSNGTYLTGAAADSGDGPPGDATGAAKLPGVDVYGNTSSLPTGNSPRTYEVWFKTTTPSGGGNNASELWSAGDAAFYIFNDTDISVVGSNGNNETSIPYALDNGLWHQVAISYNGTTALVYVDGNAVATLQPAYNTSADGTVSVGGYFGSYDEFAIYPAALTSSQINAHWSIGASTSAKCAPSPSSAYGQNIVALHPDLYFQLKERDSNSSARVAYDASGHCSNGAYLPSALPDPGDGPPENATGAVTLPGVDVYGNTSTLPTGNSARTYEIWFKTTTPSGGGNNASELWSSGDAAFYIFNDTDISVVGSNGNNETSIPYALDDGLWHQVAVSYDGTTAAVYIDGKPVATLNPRFATSPYGLVLLGGYSGSYDEFAIFPTALSNQAIAGQYALAEPQLGLNGGSLTPGQSPTGSNFCLVCFIKGVVNGIASLFPINTESGNFFHSFSDISIPGRSYPLAIVRTYNSQNASVNGPFGYGWTYNYNMSLAVSGTSPNQVATITQEDGSQATFNQPASGSSWAPSAPRFIANLTYNGGTSSWTFVRQGRDTYTFNSAGQLTSETDLNGYKTSLTYASGRLSTLTDPAGRKLTIKWTGGNITSVTDSNVSGNTRNVTYQYNDGSGNLTDVFDVNGGHDQFTYVSHLMTVMKDPNCSATSGCPGVQNHYDSSNRVDWQKDQLNRKTSLSYSGDPQSLAGGTTIVTDPKGNQVEDGYEYGVRIFETRGYGTSAAATTSFRYDPNTLALIAVVDPKGNTTTYANDASGNPLTVTDPIGRVASSTYNSFNEPLTVQDGNGVTTTNAYDARGNLTSTSTPVTGTTCTCEVVTYNHTDSAYPGDVTSVVDGDGKITSFHYDKYGDKVETRDPLGNVSGSAYNADGWLTASYTPKAVCTWGTKPPTGCSSAYETLYSYIISGLKVDEFGDVQGITDPLGHTTTYTYDANRNVTSTRDGDANVTTNAYDLDNELCWTLPGAASSNTCASPPANARVTDYNLDGSVHDQKDGKGNAILTYGYNTRGQVTSTTDGLGNVTTYALDRDGNVVNKIDPGGSCGGTVSKCTTNTYDADNELKTVSYSNSPSENIKSVSYDADGQRTAMTDGTGSSSWVYDNLHRITSYTNGNGATVGYSYNLRDEPLTIAYPGTGHTVTYAYDADGRMNSLKDWLSTAANAFVYDANSNLTQDKLRNGVTDTYGFNAADQETSISDVSGGTTIFAATYTRDGNGQVASDTSQSTNQSQYKYTALNQVCYGGSSNTTACTSPPSSSYPYAYDNADNLTTMENAAHTGKNTQQFNNADELCWVVGGTSSNACGSAPTGATAFGYNSNGDRTSKVPASGSATCDTYDQANRLTEIQTGTGPTCTTSTTVGTYAYDGDGTRESKTVGTTTTQFLWDGSGGNLLDEKSGTANPLYYIYGPGSLPVEQIDTSGTAHFYSHDQIGSTRAVSSATGTLQNTYSYDPYGNVVSSTGSVTNHLKFGSQYQDTESSLYYLRARYYDPTTGQFLTTDPLVSLTRGPYAYAGGNPTNGIDPTGLEWCKHPVNGGCSSVPPGYTGQTKDCFVMGSGGMDDVTTEASVSCSAFTTSPQEQGPSYVGWDPSQDAGCSGGCWGGNGENTGGAVYPADVNGGHYNDGPNVNGALGNKIAESILGICIDGAIAGAPGVPEVVKGGATLIDVLHLFHDWF